MFTYNWSFFTYNFSVFTYSWSFFAYSGKVRLIGAFKQRSLTVSKKAPTVRRKASPPFFIFLFFPFLAAPFFTQISGRNFLPEVWGGVHPETAPLQALCCAPCSTEQSTFRGGKRGKKVLRKGEEEGWSANGAKRKKGRVKTGQFLAAPQQPNPSYFLACVVLLCFVVGFQERPQPKQKRGSNNYGAKFYTHPPPHP